MNPNHGDYLGVVRHEHDGCQFNPKEKRGALTTDPHFQHTRATVLVGSSDRVTGIQYRLCASCAALPQWNGKGHLHRPITGDK